MTIDLEPCPFCDHGAVLVKSRNRHPNDGEFDVECDNCGAAIRGETTPERAIAAWNTRAPTAAARERDGLREENARLERALKMRIRLSETNRKFWLRAAKRALSGDMRELRNRVDLAEAPPVDVVLSEARQALQAGEKG